jgi:hypothetical protein
MPQDAADIMEGRKAGRQAAGHSLVVDVRHAAVGGRDLGQQYTRDRREVARRGRVLGQHRLLARHQRVHLARPIKSVTHSYWIASFFASWHRQSARKAATDAARGGGHARTIGMVVSGGGGAGERRGGSRKQEGGGFFWVETRKVFSR